MKATNKRSGSNNPNWRGGRIALADGRVAVYKPDHPGANLYGGSHILEYRLIAEKITGRPLRTDEIVHHVNGDPTDNRVENLQVMSQSEHAAITHLGRRRSTRRHKNIRPHYVVAERVLGRPLPSGAMIMFLDGNGKNSQPSNLVICQSRSYMGLLMARKRIKLVGGNPDTQRVCSSCLELKAKSNFNKRPETSTGLRAQCATCQKLVLELSTTRKERRAA